MEKLIKIGAESIIILKNSKIMKKRLKKKYRIDYLDRKLRKQRTRREANILRKVLELGVKVPRVLKVTNDTIVMEYIDGKPLSEILEKENYLTIAEKLGKILGTLHKYKIMHGDLTTSNMILKDGEIFLIDFGLSKFTGRVEDYAVDILLLKRAVFSKHPKIAEEFFNTFLETYLQTFRKGNLVLEKIKEIEKRWRYTKRSEGR